jgi:phosphoribosylglycinamide formyltransferase-1
MMRARTAVVVLISGRGSNLQAILDEVRADRLPVKIHAVISNNPEAPGLAPARAASLPTHVVNHRDYPDRAQFDQALMREIDAYAPELVVLAGFLRLLTPAFIKHYAGRLMNIHPSLLPQFPGLNTHARVLASGARVHGASVHFVTPDMDAGPIIIQAAVPVRPTDTPSSRAARVLEQEHRIYPLAIRWFAEGRLRLQDGQVLLDGAVRPEQGLVSRAELPES